MKSAEEWDKVLSDTVQMCLENTHYDASEEVCAVIKQIQLDAMREGARRAANVIPKSELPKGMTEGTMEAYYWNNGYVTAAVGKHHAILTTAEQWTEKDL